MCSANPSSAGEPADRIEQDRIELSPMRWWHLPDVLRLDGDLFGPTSWSAENFWAELAAPGRTYLVALDAADTDDGAAGAHDSAPGAADTQDAPSTAGTADAARPSPDGRVVGFAGLAAGGAEAEVQTIAVAAAAQGAGLGRRLLRALIGMARQAGAVSILLEVRADNDGAIRLYRREGFEQIAVRRGYYAAIGVDALIMRRRIAG